MILEVIFLLDENEIWDMVEELNIYFLFMDFRANISLPDCISYLCFGLF